MHEYGFICSTSVPDVLWFLRPDVRPVELRWLSSGWQIVTFMLQESVSTGLSS